MKKLIVSFFVIMVLLYFYGHFFTKGMITGTYVYYPSSAAIPYGEIPNNLDTLVLKSDNTFISNYYGTGTYKIEQGFDGTYFNLTYKYEFGDAGFSSYFFRPYLIGKPGISVVSDLGLYYQKVD